MRQQRPDPAMGLRRQPSSTSFRVRKGPCPLSRADDGAGDARAVGHLEFARASNLRMQAFKEGRAFTSRRRCRASMSSSAASFRSHSSPTASERLAGDLALRGW